MTVKKQAIDARPVRAAGPLYREIRAVLEAARAGAYRAVNTAMVQAYWHVGRLIVEHEQGGLKRAAYGEAVLDDVSQRLTAEFGRGFDPSNLRYMRLFFQKFPNRDAVRHTLPPAGIRDALRHELKPAEERHATRSESAALRAELSWTHYRLLLGVEDKRDREWYMHEAADQHWSTRQLERQISVLYYDRLLASRKKAPLRKEARQTLAAIGPEAFIRDPYGDNPTIGLILCSKKNEAVAKYSVLSEGKRLFAAKYVKVLPTEAVLKRQIERERRLIDSGRPAKSYTSRVREH
jgi:predicted nuclease of restriction endonuclease-like (RecB) superfamily